MFELVAILVLIGALALVAAPWIRRRAGSPRGEVAPGTLLVTGVSPPPDADGQQFVTISGVITGPTLTEHVVYQRMVVDVNDWPKMGDLIPVVYSPKNPDNWRFGSPDAPPPPPQQPTIS